MGQRPSYTHGSADRLTEDDSCYYGYDDAGRMIYRKHKVSGYGYNDAGRMINGKYRLSGDSTTFEYTVDGQLIKAHNDDIELQFAYDGIGNRIRKIIIENSDTTVVKYSYDGADLLFEKDEGDTLRIRYLYGPGIDHILESVDSVGTKQHFADALGSVTRITDSTGARYKLMVYSSYGVMSTDSGSVLADYVSYTGREAERDLGIYYYRARYYDPLTGRFMVRDPIDFYGGDINLYRYVRNNPVNITDAMGLKINWRNFNPVNPNVRRNFELLNEAIMAMGYPDDSFTLYVTGGDRHPNRFGIHVDLGDGKEVPDSDSKSPHLLSRGARAIDFKLIGLNITPSEQRSIIDCALLKTEFAAFNTEPKNEYGTEPVYEKGHIHIALPMSEFPQKYYMYDLPQRPISDYLRTTLR